MHSLPGPGQDSKIGMYTCTSLWQPHQQLMACLHVELLYENCMHM